MKDSVINALFGIREEYFCVLFRDYRLKDRYGNIWDVRTVEFNEKWTILRLGLDGTENYSAVMISADGSTNEFQEYELLHTTLQLFHKKNVIQDFLMYNKFANKKIRKKVILYDRLIIQRKNYNW